MLSMSAAFDNDEDFLAMVRKLFSFTELRPPPPQYKMKRGQKSNPTPVAKQVFGDFISWKQTESAKEKRQPERVTKAVRRSSNPYLTICHRRLHYNTPSIMSI